MMEAALVARLQFALDPSFYAGVRYSWFGFNRGERGSRVALSIVTPGEEWTHDGRDGLDEPRLRFDIYGEDSLAVTALSRALRDEMAKPADAEGFRFHEGECAADRTFPAEENEGGVTEYRRQLEFLLYYEEI